LSRQRSLTGRPQSFITSYACDCDRGWNPRRAPRPWTTIRSPRDAVIRGSFWRRLPAAALRGLANGALPASTSDALRSANADTGK
jgi:hypothetical protein